MMIQRTRRQDTPKELPGHQSSLPWLGPARRGLHQGQRSYSAAPTGRTHDRNPQWSLSPKI